MNTTSKIVLIIAAFMAAGTGSCDPRQWDLEQAINLALKQNHRIGQSSTNLQSSQLGIDGARAGFRLSIRPEASVGYSDSNGTTRYGVSSSKRFLTGTEIFTSLVNADDSDGEGRHNRARIEIRQPLFRNAGRLVNEEPIVRANRSWFTARRFHELDRVNLVMNVVRLYEEILRLEQQLKANKKSLQRSSTLARISRAKEKIGWTTRIDTLRAELQLGEAESRLQSNRERLEASREEFTELLGLPIITSFDLRETELPELELPEMESAIRTALENRLDYAQVLQDADDAKRGVKIADKGLLPGLQLVARYERADDDIFFGDEGFSGDTWSIGLSSDTDFHRRQEKVAYSQALLNHSAANEAIEISRLAIIRQVRKRIADYRLSRSNHKIAQRNFRHASSRLKLARRLFDMGRESQFSVTDAEESFLQAESRFLSGRAEASVSGYELLRTLGTLIEVPVELLANNLPADIS